MFFLDPLVRVAQLSSRTYSRLLERAVTHHYQTIMQYSRESAMRLTRLRTMIPLCNPQIDRQEWTDFALASSHDPDWRVREGTAELLGQLENNRPEVFNDCLDFLSDAHSDVRQASAKALGALGHREEEVITKLLALLTESNWRSKQIAVETLDNSTARNQESGSICFAFFQTLTLSREKRYNHRSPDA